MKGRPSLLVLVCSKDRAILTKTSCTALELGMFSPLALGIRQSMPGEGHRKSENTPRLVRCQGVPIRGPLFKVHLVIFLFFNPASSHFLFSILVFFFPPLDLPPHMKPMFEPDEAIEWKPPMPRKEFKENESLTGIAAFITPDLFEKTPPPKGEPYVLPKML